MRLVLKLKLDTNPQQAQALAAVQAVYVACCNDLSQRVFADRCWSKFTVQQTYYYDLKALYSLPAQLLLRAIAEVCSAYKAQAAQIVEHNKTSRTEERRELTRVVFKPNSAVVYDEWVLSYPRAEPDTLSLTTLSGRLTLHFHVGEKRRHLLAYRQGQADLKRYGKVWYLVQTLDVPEAATIETSEHLGVDAGICTVATITDGCQTQQFPGSRIRQIRQHHYHLRHGLQRHNTKSSRRRVRRLKGKESRQVRDYNHLLSCRVVATAQRTRSCIVLEELSGIQDGTRVSKEQRRERFSWAYAQLRDFIGYKARQAGIPILFVPPAYTSKTCSRCHYMHDGNRPSQAWFHCKECGFCCHADANAARNIRFLGAESTRQKRTVGMQECLHTDRRKPVALAIR